jgi:hypothetical protein
MYPGQYHQAGLSSDTVLQGTKGYTQFLREQVASPAEPAGRCPGEGSCPTFFRYSGPGGMVWGGDAWYRWPVLKPGGQNLYPPTPTREPDLMSSSVTK